MNDSNSGYLSIAGFRQVLKECQIYVTEDDLYHILSEFDEGLNGKISYEQFLGSIVEWQWLDSCYISYT